MSRLLWLAALGLVACRTLPRTPPDALAALAATPGAHLAGVPAGLGEPVVLNREDFVYDAKLSPDGALAATSRLGMKAYHLVLSDLRATPPTRRADVALNVHEFDVEALDFSPDGAAIATASRDGALRVYATKDGAPLAAWLTEEPLTAVAWNAAGTLLALGGAKGLVTLVAWPSMQHVAELRAHADEVRAVAFTPAGELVTGGWDAKLNVFSVVPAAAPERSARTHVTKKDGLVLFRAVLDRSASAVVALDARLPALVVKGALAQAASIDLLKLTDTLTIPTALGNQVARVAHGRTLSVKGLTFVNVDVAVCDACVPAGAQAVLGGPALDRVEVAFDEATKEVLFTGKPGAADLESAATQTLALARSFVMKAPVNDFALDAAGRIAGVAFSETKGERTKAVYDREKKKEVEPEREWDCAARVDLMTGAVLEQKHGHRGVVSTAAVSPDGQTLVSGGWDKQVIVHAPTPLVDDRYGWSVRRVRFSRDGRWLIVAAWTPQNPLGNNQSDPSAVVFEVLYERASVSAPGR
jgi:WD40 repeat protein